MMIKRFSLMSLMLVTLAPGLLLGACLSQGDVGIAPAAPANTTVRMDFYDKPLPSIPLPNDVATRYDASSPTGRRINASLLAPTHLEQRVRTLLDEVDGWGIFMPISIPFTGPLDVQSVLDAHRDLDYDLTDDVVYLVNVDRGSDRFGDYYHLDLGNGNFPVTLEQVDGYWKNDSRGHTLSLMFEETDEDLNGNGVLDPGEDTDSDGVLDVANYLPGKSPAREDLAGRADALMTFYEKETHTLLIRPLMPLDEQTTYAVVITKRLKDAAGESVGSPYPGINHHSQTAALEPLAEVMAKQDIGLDDVAFAFTFTTQSLASTWQVVRDGLYGYGIQGHLATEFPDEPAGFEVLRDVNFPGFEDIKNPHIMYYEDWAGSMELIGSTFLGADEASEFKTKLLDAQKYVDFHVVGYFDSPQLFERFDETGKLLPYNQQSWPSTLHSKRVKARSERVYFHMTVPRKEISVRGQGKPAPVVIMGHGYTGNRFDAVTMGGYLAKHGVAVVGIDCVSHGLVLSDEEAVQAEQIMGLFGLAPLMNVVTQFHRALDLNNDASPDSGGDFWSSYLFHTRDVVRQSALDYMQLTRILKAFDGTKRWNLDLNGDGENELAGDFDGDGVVDVGGDAHIGFTGASLGGIMAAYVAAVEPNVTVSSPIAGGGGLGDIGNRSIQGGVREAVHLRVMGPLYVATGSADSGEMTIETIIPDLNDDATRTLTSVSGVSVSDVVIADNLVNHERGCGVVWDDAGTLRVRVAVASDEGDATSLRFYPAGSLVLGSTECELNEGATAYRTVETFERAVTFQNVLHNQGEPLSALAEGLGLRRGNPEIRRFMALGQMVMDGGDPAAVAPYLQTNPIHYANGQTTGAHILVVTTGGDMNVPTNTGISVGRAAGLINYLDADERYKGTEHEGKSQLQVLLDSHQAESIEAFKRYTDSSGKGVLMDVENFSQGLDPWGDEIKRLDPPLRAGFYEKDLLGGYSAAIFPFPQPSGQHGFAMPGGFLDMHRDACTASCAEGEDCGCAEIGYEGHFDIGNYMFNMMGRYLATNGQELLDDVCMSSDDCTWIPAIPEER